MAGEILLEADWPTTALGEVVKNFDSKRVPLSSRERQLRQGKYPYYGAAGCIDHVDDYLFEGLHLLVGEDGSVIRPDGRPFLQLVNGKFWVNNHAHVLRGDDETETKFLFYALETCNVSGMVTGAVQPKITQANLNSIRFCYPPRKAREKIVRVLGALDDKIELNRRMNATLEAMARALFQSWFVDFDPVRAKLDGRPPAALDPATAALFPDAFDETALGHIPHGWEVKTLGEVIELAYGKPLKAEDRKNGPVCVYGANGPVGWHDEKLVSGPGIVVGRKGNPGVVTWAHGDFYPIDTTFYVEPRGECCSLYFLYYALSLHNLANLSADSAVPGLNRNHAYMSKQVIPSEPVLTAFDSQIAPIFASIHANTEQSRTLATLRDTLLPKLLSGELSSNGVNQYSYA